MRRVDEISPAGRACGIERLVNARGGLALLAAIAALAGCSEEDPPQPPPNGTAPGCCLSETGMTVRPQCLPGETRAPVSRCSTSNPDAGTMPGPCGDGMKDPATEVCDASDPMGATCPLGFVCNSSCTCQSTCGNGVVDTAQGENCERNSDCTTGADLACRRCLCTIKSTPVVFDDRLSDLTQDAAGAPYTDFDEIQMTVDGGASELVDVKLAADVRRPSEPVRICLAVIEASAEVATLCYTHDTAGAVDLFLTTPAGGERSVLQPGVNVRSIASGFRVEIADSLGVPFRSDLQFYWYSKLGDKMADRMPDEGTYEMTEFFGR